MPDFEHYFDNLDSGVLYQAIDVQTTKPIHAGVGFPLMQLGDDGLRSFVIVGSR